MMNRQLVSSIARCGAACAIAASLLVTSSTLAATIEIGLTGLDLVYDGTALYDAGNSNTSGSANPADADPLTSVVITVDSSPVATLTSDISLDVYIPDISGISAAANTNYATTTPGNPGFFDLLIGTSPLASEFLLVDLSEVAVTYIDVMNIVQFTFGAAVSDVFAQNLPAGLIIGDPVSVSFSAQLVPGSRTVIGNTITGFEARGTGNLQGPAVPEPSTCILAVLSLVALAARNR